MKQIKTGKARIDFLLGISKMLSTGVKTVNVDGHIVVLTPEEQIANKSFISKIRTNLNLN